MDIPDAQEEADTDWETETGWKQECCGAGDLVLIHGESCAHRGAVCPEDVDHLYAGGVQHQSPHNLSDKTRFIYTFHMIEGAPGYTYDEKNWSVSIQHLPAS